MLQSTYTSCIQPYPRLSSSTKEHNHLRDSELVSLPGFPALQLLLFRWSADPARRASAVGPGYSEHQSYSCQPSALANLLPSKYKSVNENFHVLRRLTQLKFKKKPFTLETDPSKVVILLLYRSKNIRLGRFSRF